MEQGSYQKFKNYIKEKKYEEASRILIDNPKVKDNLSKNEWKLMYNHLEESIIRYLVKKLDKTNASLRELNSNLEKTARGAGGRGN